MVQCCGRAPRVRGAGSLATAFRAERASRYTRRQSLTVVAFAGVFVVYGVALEVLWRVKRRQTS